MKFCQFVEYKMRNIFLEKSYRKCGAETIPRPFSKKSKLSISLDQQSQMLYSFFLLYVQGELYQNISKLRCWPHALPLYKAFLKTNGGLELVSLPHFLHVFWKKIFLLLHSINWPNFIAWLPLLLELLGNMCSVIVCKPACDVINFEFTLMFLI